MPVTVSPASAKVLWHAFELLKIVLGRCPTTLAGSQTTNADRLFSS
jgi:hypothetical protein